MDMQTDIIYNEDYLIGMRKISYKTILYGTKGFERKKTDQKGIC